MKTKSSKGKEATTARKKQDTRKSAIIKPAKRNVNMKSTTNNM